MMQSTSNRHPIVALTGGIGAGKSYVARHISASHGIDIYDCDQAAKRLMRESVALQEALSRLIGEDICRDGKLQKHVLAKFLLSSESNKQAVNDIVHPAVALDFESSEYTWLESAILFESRFSERTTIDVVVCVTAPDELRAQRVSLRDNISLGQAQQWIDRQMAQAEIATRSDYVIVNDGICDLDKQIKDILHHIYNNNKNKF